MTIGLASIRAAAGPGRVEQALRSFEAEARGGRPDLLRLWREHGGDGSLAVLSALIKADLAARFRLGERPDVHEYLDRFPTLRDAANCVLSLVYEEFCLREEGGENPNPESFCERYAPWKDSLASQLRYHRVISRVVGVAPPAPRFPEPGETFEHFLIDSELGRGGAARVYLARDAKLGYRPVALKVSPDRGNEPSILGRLEHPHIISVLSLANQAETNLRGLCMPYRPGMPLDRLIARLDPASRPSGAGAIRETASRREEASATEPRATAADGAEGPGWAHFPERGTYADGVAWVVATLAEALAYAHQNDIVHRDVKPANILITYQEGPQLLDFNLSHDPHSPEQAEAALRGGTLPYMAPEQLRAFIDPSGWDRVTGSSDVYSLGLLMWEFLTGAAPETPDPTLPLPRAILGLLDRRAELKPDLRRVDPSMRRSLESILARCLQFDPENRYADATQLAVDLRRFLDRRPLAHAPNLSARESAGNWLSRHRSVLAVASGVVAFALVAGLVLRSGMTPLEQRPIFREAILALDQGKYDDVISKLTRNPQEAERSPLASLLLAIACSRDKREESTGKWLLLAMRDPQADAALLRGFHDHPRLLSSSESLVGIVFRAETSRTGDRPKAILDSAERLIGLVLKVTPNSQLALRELAVLSERRGDYALAHSALGQVASGVAIAGQGSTDTKPIASSLQMRARVLTAWAKWLAAATSNPNDLAHDNFLLDEAIDDLSSTIALSDRDDPQDSTKRYELDFVGCEAAMEKGDIEAKLGRSAEATRHYQEAARLLASMEGHKLATGSSFDGIARRVESRWVSTRPADPAATHVTIRVGPR